MPFIIEPRMSQADHDVLLIEWEKTGDRVGREVAKKAGFPMAEWRRIGAAYWSRSVPGVGPRVRSVLTPYERERLGRIMRPDLFINPWTGKPPEEAQVFAQTRADINAHSDHGPAALSKPSGGFNGYNFGTLAPGTSPLQWNATYSPPLAHAGGHFNGDYSQAGAVGSAFTAAPPPGSFTPPTPASYPVPSTSEEEELKAVLDADNETEPEPEPVLEAEDEDEDRPIAPPYDGDESQKILVPVLVPKYFRQHIAGSTDVDIIMKAISNRKHIMLLGDTGLGKTTALKIAAYRLQMPYFPVNLNGGTTAEDLLGAWVPDPSGGFRWQDGVLTHFMRVGGLFVTEEINAANPEILFAFHSVLDDHKRVVLSSKDGEVVTAHPDFSFAATMNPNFAGTQELNKALADRFEVTLEFTGQNIPKIFADHPKVVEFYQKLSPMILSGEIEGTLSTRGLQQFVDNSKIFGKEVARSILAQKFEKGAGQESVVSILDSMGL